MYVFFKDKNGTVDCVNLRLNGNVFNFMFPVFVFKTLKTLTDLKEEYEIIKDHNLERVDPLINLKKPYSFGLSGLNPYELAYISDNLNHKFYIEQNMYTRKEIIYKLFT